MPDGEGYRNAGTSGAVQRPQLGGGRLHRQRHRWGLARQRGAPVAGNYSMMTATAAALAAPLIGWRAPMASGSLL